MDIQNIAKVLTNKEFISAVLTGADKMDNLADNLGLTQGQRREAAAMLGATFLEAISGHGESPFWEACEALERGSELISRYREANTPVDDQKGLATVAAVSSAYGNS
ncbi:hypothetical protein KAJ83_01675 [Marivibrio halodurans]|uniref:Uncharacterized protein n=1 Tax=Marivibrio halodurans TaxID=2039722 RepID=A0A8J7V1C9_9PROT|nr:hypothetical protein [Marivibrio halodurans]MBP5855702.1 hypothetical protein [Marivibrio halodurans]